MFKSNRLKVGIAGLGLLAFGVFGMAAPAAHAQVIGAPIVQAQSCNIDQANSTATGATDAQCGDQSSVDTLGTGPETAGTEAVSAAAEGAGTEAVSAAPDTDTVQSGSQSGSQVEDGLPDLASAAPETSG